MADEQNSGGNVRRVSARDRKRRIEPRDLSFPPDDLPSEPFDTRDDVATPDESPAASSSTDASVGTTYPSSASDTVSAKAAPASPTPSPRKRPPQPGRFPPIPEVDNPQLNARPRAAAPAAPVRKRRRFGLRDVVALLFALATCGVVAYFVYIWQNPYSLLNPLAPPVLPPLVVTETPTPTPTNTATATATRRPTATFTPLPAAALTDLPGSTTVAGTPDLTLTLLAGTPSATPPPPPFVVRPFPLVYTSNAQGGCDYSGIAGSVTGFEGQPLNGYIVWITGEEIDSRLTSGSDNTYGAGGFNLQVGTSTAVRAYAAQLLAPDGVTPLSEPFTFLSREACEFNIALVRFVQVRELP
ncbi:MAG: hypothetical protein SF123_06470 [Chloroflexota bacterium]|nr:hypothetical protein [Chloroflexota bacterium]